MLIVGIVGTGWGKSRTSPQSANKATSAMTMKTESISCSMARSTQRFAGTSAEAVKCRHTISEDVVHRVTNSIWKRSGIVHVAGISIHVRISFSATESITHSSQVVSSRLAKTPIFGRRTFPSMPFAIQDKVRSDNTDSGGSAENPTAWFKRLVKASNGRARR
nr:hypothetical protein CFP56_71257 [Quercus suber]